MPRTLFCSNPKCRKPRKPGGLTKVEGLCRLCWHQARMALHPSQRKRGPNTGRSAKGKPPRPKSPRVVSQPSAAERAAAITPPGSWWLHCPPGDDWRTRQDAQRERFSKVHATAAEIRRDMAMSGLL